MQALQRAFLEKRIDPKLISVRQHPEQDLFILNYTKSCMYDNVWNDETRYARGLILDGAGDVYARSFAKFFNVDERPETLLRNLPLDQPFAIYEKIDGCLGVFTGGQGRRFGFRPAERSLIRNRRGPRALLKACRLTGRQRYER